MAVNEYLSAVDLATDIRAKKVSPVEVMDECIGRDRSPAKPTRHRECPLAQHPSDSSAQGATDARRADAALDDALNET